MPVHRSRTSRTVLAALATPVAMLAAGALIYQASYAAFTGQTRNSGNEWSTGSVNLTDDDNGQSRLQVTNMLPDSTDTKCITVTADASVPSTVKGYVVNPVTSSAGLADHIDVTIEGGQGGSFASCDGFTADASGPLVADTPLSTLFTVDSYDHPGALGGWDVAPGTEERTYRFTWVFDTAGMTQEDIDQLQGAKTGVDMQWEMQSN